MLELCREINRLIYNYCKFELLNLFHRNILPCISTYVHAFILTLHKQIKMFWINSQNLILTPYFFTCNHIYLDTFDYVGKNVSNIQNYW